MSVCLTLRRATGVEGHGQSHGAGLTAGSIGNTASGPGIAPDKSLASFFTPMVPEWRSGMTA